MHSDAENYLMALAENFGVQAASGLAVVQAGAFACSLIRRNGGRPHFPVAVVVESLEQMERISSSIAVFSSKLTSLNATPKKFTEMIASCHDDIFWLYHAEGRYSEQNFEYLLEICGSGEIQGEPFEAVVVLCFQHWLPAKYSQNISMLICPKCERDCSAELNRFVFLDNLEQFLLERVGGPSIECFIDKPNQKLDEIKDSRFWKSAIKILEGFLRRGDSEAEPKRNLGFKDACILAAEAAESCDLESQIPEMFQEAAALYCPEISSMVARQNAGNIPQENRDETPLYDSDSYYFPEELFEKICRPLLAYCHINQIKAALESAGVLFSHGRGRIYRTVKIKIHGTDDSPRYVKLKRALLDNVEGELTIEERINSKG